MDTTRNEASEALQDVEAAVRSVKHAVDRHSSEIVLIWATAYFLAPLCMHLWPRWGLIPQQLLLITAIVYTIVVTTRNSPISGPSSWRIAGLWWLTCAFGWVWFLILNPDPHGGDLSRQMWAYGVSLAMFVYVVMGLWIGRLYVVTGLAVTLLTLVGLLWLGEWYWLWCAITGGGTLLVAGLWLRTQRAECLPTSIR